MEIIHLPQNILIYRDGVSEGQYNIVLTKELQSIKEACKAVYKKKHQPNITILVGGKSHNARFFPTKQSDLDRTVNCPNGSGQVLCELFKPRKVKGSGQPARQ